MNKARYYINTEGNDDEAYQDAIYFAYKLCDKDLYVRRVVLLIYKKDNVGWFERLYGEKIVQKLFDGQPIFNNKPSIKFETVKTFNDDYTSKEIVITCGLEDIDIFEIEDFYSVKAIIAVPWVREDIEKWVRVYNPTELRENRFIINPIERPSKIIIKAIEELTNSINMSTGINHPGDARLAQTIVYALYKFEPKLDPEVIFSYLVNELNWKVKHAQQIEILILKTKFYKQFKENNISKLQNYYKHWQELTKNEA